MGLFFRKEKEYKNFKNPEDLKGLRSIEEANEKIAKQKEYRNKVFKEAQYCKVCGNEIDHRCYIEEDGSTLCRNCAENEFSLDSINLMRIRGTMSVVDLDSGRSENLKKTLKNKIDNKIVTKFCCYCDKIIEKECYIVNGNSYCLDCLNKKYSKDQQLEMFYRGVLKNE